MPSYQYMIIKVMSAYKWHKSFATEYVMARHYHQMGHASAFREAMKSPYVSVGERPKFMPEEKAMT